MVPMGSPARSARSRAARWSTGRLASSPGKRRLPNGRRRLSGWVFGRPASGLRARCSPRSIRPSMAPSQLGQRREIGDAVEPGARLGLRGQAGKGPIRLDVCVLEHFVHTVAIAEQVEHELAKHRVVVLDHGGERTVVAGDGPSHHVGSDVTGRDTQIGRVILDRFLRAGASGQHEGWLLWLRRVVHPRLAGIGQLQAPVRAIARRGGHAGPGAELPQWRAEGGHIATHGNPDWYRSG